jgi:hypothetical protein
MRSFDSQYMKREFLYATLADVEMFVRDLFVSKVHQSFTPPYATTVFALYSHNMFRPIYRPSSGVIYKYN